MLFGFYNSVCAEWHFYASSQSLLIIELYACQLMYKSKSRPDAWSLLIFPVYALLTLLLMREGLDLLATCWCDTPS